MRGRLRVKEAQESDVMPKAGAQAPVLEAKGSPKTGEGLSSSPRGSEKPKARAQAQPEANKNLEGRDGVPAPERKENEGDDVPSEESEKPKATAQVRPEASKNRKEGDGVPSPEESEEPRATAQAQPEASKNRKEGDDVPSPETPKRKEKSQAGAQALEPEASENSKEGEGVPAPKGSENTGLAPEIVEKANKAGGQPLQVKEAEKKEVDSNTQVMEMMKALREQMNEVSALREQMKKMEMEKKEQQEKIEEERKDKAARKQLKREAALKKGQDEHPVCSDLEKDPESENEKSETPREEGEHEESDEEQGDRIEEACTPIPSSEDEEDPSEEEEDEQENEERSERLQQKRRGKELRKDAKYAQKLSIKMDIEASKAYLKVMEKSEQTMSVKLEEAERNLMQEKEAQFAREEQHRTKSMLFNKRHGVLRRAHDVETAALKERQKEERSKFEEGLERERNELRAKQKSSMAELEEEYNAKKEEQEAIEQLAVHVKGVEAEYLNLKKTREKKFEEKGKLEGRLIALSKKYENLSVRCQRERKEKKEEEAKLKEEGWAEVVARPKPKPKEEKTSGPRKIPKHQLPHLAPKERYGDNEKMPCPSWLTRVAAGTDFCPVGSNCPEILRGCNLFHKDVDMLHAFVRGVRPVGWTEVFEKNLRSEIDYWKGRKDHTFHNLIPEVMQLNPWDRKKDTEEEKENEMARIGRLIEGLSARKRSGPGGAAGGGRGGGRGQPMMANRGRPHGISMAQEQLIPPMGQFPAYGMRGRGGQKRSNSGQGQARRGRGRGDVQVQRGAFAAPDPYNQRGRSGYNADYPHDEQNVGYGAVEFTGARN